MAKEYAKKRAANTNGHKKRGPKTDGKGAHNEKIAEEANRIEDAGGTILFGGQRKGLKEAVIKTPGGHKGTRRPDILYEDKNGVVRGLKVGRRGAGGNPITREVKALEDLNNHAKIPTTFTPYD